MHMPKIYINPHHLFFKQKVDAIYTVPQILFHSCIVFGCMEIRGLTSLLWMNICVVTNLSLLQMVLQ